MATCKDQVKGAEFSCGRLGFGMEKYINQNAKEKNIENIINDVAEGGGMYEDVNGYGPQTVLSGAKDSADDCLAMKCGIRIRSCAIGSPGRKNKLVRPMNITFAVYWGKFPSFSSSLFSILFIVGCFVCYL